MQHASLTRTSYRRRIDLRRARCAAFSGLFMVLSGHVWAAGKIQYGSRSGMEMTITGMSGIGSDHAVIRAQHTREDAQEYCREYEQTKSRSCIERTLHDTQLSDQIEGNCESGVFTTFYGERFHFVGPNKPKDAHDPKYRVLDAQGEVLDGSEASGYPYSLEQFRALCPNRGVEAGGN